MIVLAPDKFKGSLSAQQVCHAIREGLLELDKDLDIVYHPMADGGEGTADLLIEFSGAERVNLKIQDPLFREIDAEYGISSDGSTAFIEMAKASGLQLLAMAERNVMITSTIGTGQLIADALERGVSRIILGVGGSATNDGGMGMAQALGIRFYGATGKELKPVGENLLDIHRIDSTLANPRMKECQLTAIYDVACPLYGPNGAAHVFARQKGATDEGIEFLDRGLLHLAAVIMEQFHQDVNFEGAGAGGGLPAMAKVLFPSQFERGIDFIVRFTRLEDLVRRASVVITGEGKIDQQTLTGKVVKGVGSLCRQYSKVCVAFTGRNELPAGLEKQLGLTAVVAISDGKIPEQQAMEQAYSLLKNKVILEMPRWIPRRQK